LKRKPTSQTGVAILKLMMAQTILKTPIEEGLFRLTAGRLRRLEFDSPLVYGCGQGEDLS